MKKILLSLVLLLLVSVPVSAAPPAPSGTIAIAEGSDLSFGGLVTFDTTVSGLKPQQYPLIYVECFQDNVKVWGQLRAPDHVFRLGGDSSLWISNGGGPADCIAWLRVYGGHPVNLDSVSFTAAG